MASPRPPTAAYAAWLTVCVTWGTTYLAIRIALETIPPAMVGAIRFVVAGTVLLAYVRWRHGRLPPTREWPMQALIGVLMMAVGNGFIVWAEQWLPSGIAALGIATTPFWMTGIEALGGERLTARVGVGFALGVTGIGVLIWPELVRQNAGGSHFIAGIVAVQLACFGWSIGGALSKRRAGVVSSLGASGLQQLFGGVSLLAIAAIRGEFGLVAFSSRSLGAEVYLTILGSLTAYSAFLYALDHLPTATVSMYAYANPVIAVIVGTLIASEPFSPRIVAAVVLVLIGIAIVRSRPQSQSDRLVRRLDGR